MLSLKKLLTKDNLKTQLVILRSKPEWSYSLWTVGGQVLVSVVTLFSTLALANWVTEEVVGNYRFVLSLLATVSVFALGGISSALQQATAAGQEGSYSVAFAVKVKYGLIATVICWGSAGYFYFVQTNNDLAKALLVCGALIPWLEASGLYGSYLTGVSRFKNYAQALVLERTVLAGALIITAFFWPTFLALVITYLVASLVVRLFLYYCTKRQVPVNAPIDKHMFVYAKHLTSMSLIAAVTSQLDKFILFFFFGPAALATFWIASVLPQEVSRLVSAAGGTFFPRIVQTENEQTMVVVKKIFWLMLVLTLLLSTVYLLLAKFIFAWFLPVYAGAYLMSGALMFAFAVNPHVVVWSIFTAKKKVKELYIYSMAEPLLVCGLYLLFIPLWGVWGLVYALGARTLIMNLVAWWVLRKYRV